MEDRSRETAATDPGLTAAGSSEAATGRSDRVSPSGGWSTRARPEAGSAETEAAGAADAAARAGETTSASTRRCSSTGTRPASRTSVSDHGLIAGVGEDEKKRQKELLDKEMEDYNK